jgi:ADP-ribose pyrophosphatase YjhB (NUDIX family)
MKPGKDYIGVGGGVLILDDQDRFLLMKRGGEVRNEHGWWSKPGGKIDFGETSVDAMIREIKEEVDVEIEIFGMLPHTDHIIEGDDQHWLAVNYLARIKSGKPKIMEPHKCDELKWFGVEDELPNKITQTTREPVEYYLEGKYIEL